MRLFVSINLSKETRGQLSAVRDILHTQGNGSFTSEENLHLTLAFIGETNCIDQAKRALQSVNASPFTLRFDRIGQFGTLYWAGVCENVSLRAVQAKLIAHFRAEGFLFEEQEFIPHITLVRHFIPNANLSLVSAEQLLFQIEEPVREIALMLSRNGHYETLAIKTFSEE